MQSRRPAGRRRLPVLGWGVLDRCHPTRLDEDKLRDGYIRLYRAILEHPIFECCNEATLKVWITCLLLANWKPKTWFDGQRQVTIPRGSFVTSRSKLSLKCHLSEQRTRDSIDYLRKLDCITSQGTSHYSIITITKYDLYQFPVDLEEPTVDPTNNQPETQPITSGPPADNQRSPTTKEGNKERREEVNENPQTPAPPAALVLDSPGAVRPSLPANGNGKRHKPEMSAQQRQWFGRYLEAHPKNSVQVVSAENLWREKVHTEELAEKLIATLKRESVGDHTFMFGPGKWLADHLALYANGVEANQLSFAPAPARAAPRSTAGDRALALMAERLRNGERPL